MSLRSTFVALSLPLLVGAGVAATTATSATPAHAAAWHYLEQDGLEVRSSDGGARAVGSVRWYYGTPPYGYRHRANFTAGSRVEATRSVGCIWARVSFGYPTGSVAVGSSSVGGSLSPGQKVGSFFVSCRRPGQARPAPLSLAGVGYAKALLNSTTIKVCTSRTKAQGPRYCSYEKNVYGNG